MIEDSIASNAPASVSRNRSLRLTNASDVRPRRVKWLLTNLIPVGTITVLAGDSGIGKSTLALSWAAAATKGDLDGDFSETPSPVLIVSPEDDPAAVTRPRLEAAGADLHQARFVSVTSHTQTGAVDGTVSLPGDLPLIELAIAQTGARLIIVDPIASTLSGNLDRREDVRASFDRLAVLAQQREVAILLIAHNRKGMDRVRQRISGSAAITDAARSVLVIARDEETGRVVLSVDKSSYSKAEGLSLAYEICEVSLPTSGGDVVETTRAILCGESSISVAELYERQVEDVDRRKRRNPAQQYLLDFLEQQPQRQSPADEAIRQGQEAGFSEGHLQDARRRCKNPEISTWKDGFSGGWIWGIQDNKSKTDGLATVTKMAKAAGS